MFSAAPIARLDVHLAAVHVQMHGHGRIAFAARLSDQRFAHAIDDGEVVDARSNLVQRQDLHRILFTVSALTLRPEMTTTAGSCSWPIFPVRQAATVTAAVGSIRYWWLASIQRTASRISSSETNATRVTSGPRTPKVSAPIPPSTPPAKVSTAGSRVIARPQSRDIFSAGERMCWHPMMVAGWVANANPAESPPPPTGTMKARAEGTSSSTSSATVPPLAAITSSSSNGEMKVRL